MKALLRTAAEVVRRYLIAAAYRGIDFVVTGVITGATIIAKGSGIRERARLVRQYGRGNWRKMKGTATIRYDDGETCTAELHWYEAHGIGKVEFKVKR